MLRSRLQRAGVAVALAGLVMGCNPVAAGRSMAHASSPVKLTFWFGPDTTGATRQIVDNFNRLEAGKIKVDYQVQAASANTYFVNLRNALQAHSTTPDVIGGDVIWPAQLVSSNLILPLDKYFPRSAQAKYLPGAILDLQYKGHIYGVPWFTNFGVIYYRKDLLAKYHMAPPTTWEQMQQEALTLVHKGAVHEGFVFQGDQYEGIVCNALEYINGAGGYIYGPQAASTTTQAAKGLDTLRAMLSRHVAPPAVTTYQEAATNNDFVDGLAAFARNWPYMWANVQTSKKVAGKVGVLPMLHEPGQTGYSDLGGEVLNISKYSRHPNEAYQFIKYVAGVQGETTIATTGGEPPALSAIYDNPQARKINPWYVTVRPQLHILPRPTSPVYNDISLRMQKDFHGVLAGSMSSQQAVQDVESYVKVVEARFH